MISVLGAGVMPIITVLPTAAIATTITVKITSALTITILAAKHKVEIQHVARQ